MYAGQSVEMEKFLEIKHVTLVPLRVRHVLIANFQKAIVVALEFVNPNVEMD